MTKSTHTTQSRISAGIDEARRSVDTYLIETLGREYRSSHLQKMGSHWSFIVCYDCGDLPQPCPVGRVIVDAKTGDLTLPTEEQVREISECAAWQIAHHHGQLARDGDNYLLRHQARRLATQWLDANLSMNFSASGGLFIPLGSPIWQFSISFDLGDMHIHPLGVLDVDAISGTIEPLTNDQLNRLQERVGALIRHQELAAAA